MGIVEIVFAEVEKREPRKAAPKMRSLDDKPMKKTLPVSDESARLSLPLKFSKYQCPH